jgi:hypothetical protein
MSSPPPDTYLVVAAAAAGPAATNATSAHISAQPASNRHALDVRRGTAV